MRLLPYQFFRFSHLCLYQIPIPILGSLLTSMALAMLGNTLLRTAITRNLVSFPAQVQPFMKRGSGDLQERVVQLYFVRGWSVRSICERYGLSKAMTHKLLAEWRVRAIESGYIQEIEPGTLDALTGEANGRGANDADVDTLRVAIPLAAGNRVELGAVGAGSGV